MSQTQISELIRQAKGEERFWTLSNVCSMIRMALMPAIVLLIIRDEPVTNYSAMGLMAFAPALGGFVLDASSYTVLFSIAAGLTLAGLVVTMTLRTVEEVAAGHSAS